jgi:hypothetical protein
MRVGKVLFGAIVGVGLCAVLYGGVAAQAPAPARGGRGAAPAARVHGNLLQVMRGILYPASNVIFAAQSEDPATIKPATPDPATSPNPLTSSYGGWTAVENSGIALAEAANLLTIPGRMCSNGKPAPIQNADWQMWVQELRDAGMATYKAAQSKNMDAILDAAGVVSEACQHCHDKYREVPGGVKNRC